MKKIQSTIIPMLLACILSACGSKTIKQVDVYTPPTGPEESSINIEPINGFPDDFILGMDASSVLAEEKSGVTYYGFDGTPQDVFMTLAQSGINTIRLRVWNDPYDEEGNGYGGGNCDVNTAIELGKRASKYGMSVCIDFHYSDFWADPSKQFEPKSWVGMSLEEKSDALYSFTKESLEKMLKEGIDISMVQIGNEINNGICGVRGNDKVNTLLKAGSRAVREVSTEYDRNIDVVIHYTNVSHPNKVLRLAMDLDEDEVDYDVLGLSYYPFWDGTPEILEGLIETLLDRYDIRVVIAETSYCYTEEDGDGQANSIKGRGDILDEFPASVENQATVVRDVVQSAVSSGASGVFYWEGVWIPVGSQKSTNTPIWEKYGSGWASSYASSYDPNDAGKYYGGSSWDNQAMFDFEGYPLESLKVFRFLKYGTTVK